MGKKTNSYSRKVILEEQVTSELFVETYDTGLVRATIRKHKASYRVSIASGSDMAADGLLAPFLNLFISEDFEHISSLLPYTFTYDRRKSPLLRAVFDAENYTSWQRLAYIHSILRNKSYFDEEYIEELLKSESGRKRVESLELIRNPLWVIFPGGHYSFQYPQGSFTVDLFSKVSAFIELNDPNLTLSEFLAEYKGQHAPFHLARTSRYPHYVDRVNESVSHLGDFTSNQYINFFASTPAHRAPNAFYPWLVERFLAGFKSYKPEGQIAARFSNVVTYLDYEEAQNFLKYAAEDGKQFHRFWGVADDMSPLIAYYFVKAGWDRVKDLITFISSVSSNSFEDIHLSTSLSMDSWRNPYDLKSLRGGARYHSLMRAVESEEDLEVPLEIVLSMY